MRRTALTLGLVTIGAGLVGCESAQISRVSILNESRTEIRYNAWVVEGDVPDESTDRTLAPNASDGVTLEHPGVTSPRVAIRVRPAGEAQGVPYTAELTPPGPYTIAVRGEAGQLQLARYDTTDPNDRIAPPDPHQRGLTDDIPRPNVNFGTP